jgi:hypothetical protein
MSRYDTSEPGTSAALSDRDGTPTIPAHLDQNPRSRKVTQIAFLDGLDESDNEATYEKILYYGKLLHKAMGRGWFKYRVDGGDERPVMQRLASEVELWVCHTEDFSIDDVDYFRATGLETWFYGPMIYEQNKNGGCGSNTFLDLDLLVNRVLVGSAGNTVQAGWNGNSIGTRLLPGMKRRISKIIRAVITTVPAN